MKHGVGGFNIDECRIPYKQEDKWIRSAKNMCDIRGGNYNNPKPREADDKGRYPSNLLCQDNVLDDGEKRNQGHWAKSKVVGYGEFGGGTSEYFGVGEKDNPSSLSRYFDLDAWWGERIKNLPKNVQRTFPFMFCPKASRGEREEGLEKFEEKEIYRKSTGAFGNSNPTCKNCGGEKFPRYIPKNTTCFCEKPEWNIPKNIPSKCIHPTVKPLQLCSWLTLLCTKEGATILDPFMGSGTQGVACLITNRKFIGIEKEEEYFKLAEARIGEVAKQAKLTGFLK